MDRDLQLESAALLHQLVVWSFAWLAVRSSSSHWDNWQCRYGADGLVNCEAGIVNRPVFLHLPLEVLKALGSFNLRIGRSSSRILSNHQNWWKSVFSRASRTPIFVPVNSAHLAGLWEHGIPHCLMNVSVQTPKGQLPGILEAFTRSSCWLVSSTAFQDTWRLGSSNQEKLVPPKSFHNHTFSSS